MRSYYFTLWSRGASAAAKATRSGASSPVAEPIMTLCLVTTANETDLIKQKMVGYIFILKENNFNIRYYCLVNILKYNFQEHI
jgi:hypothetical protein